MSGKGSPGGPHRRKAKPNRYRGPAVCLRCGKTFESWDRRQNRLCPRCQMEIDREPSEEPRVHFRPPTRQWRSPDYGEL